MRILILIDIALIYYGFLALGIGNFKGDRELKGYIDELYIFNKTLNSTEIENMHCHCKGLRSSLILHLDFENVKQNETEDLSYQGNNGYFVGNVLQNGKLQVTKGPSPNN